MLSVRYIAYKIHKQTKWMIFSFLQLLPLNFFPSRMSESESESEVPQSCRLFATPWTVAYQAPPSMGFSRQECWSGLPFPSPGDLPDPGIERGSPALQADALLSEPSGKQDV